MKIYANADRVIVWLGEEADDSYMAIKAIEMLNHEESRESLFNCQHEHVCLSQLTKLYNAPSSACTSAPGSAACGSGKKSWSPEIWLYAVEPLKPLGNH
jgi:hypothetical protein